MRRRPSITGSLGVLAALVAATGVLVYLASLILIVAGTESRLRDQVREEADSRLSLVRGIVNRPVDTLAALVHLVEQAPSGPADKGLPRQVLEASYLGAAAFESLRILDSRGIVTHGTPARGAGVGLDLSGLKELRAARATNRPAWSNIHTGIAEGRREISLAIPAGNSMILATLDFERLAARILELAAYSKGGLAIVDSGGAYMMSLDQHLIERRWQDLAFVESRLRDPERAAWSYMSRPEGLEMETEARLIPETGWYLLLSRRADWAAAAIRQSLVGASLLALAACGLALGLAALTSRRLVRDLRSAVEYAAGGLEDKPGEGGREAGAALHFRETVAIVEGMARATARWRESERRFSALFEAAPIPLAIVDRFGAVLDFNRRFEDTFGYSKRDATTIAGIWQQAYPDPAVRAELERQWEATFAEPGFGSLGPVEQRVTCADGAVRDFLVSASASGDQILASFIEITERKRAETAIFKEESRLKGLLSILQAKTETRQEFLDYALDEAIKLTESEFGYIYFYDEATEVFTLNSWSKGVMKECLVQNPQSRYELEKTGIWGEAVRQRKPLLLNDFGADNPLKKGYPSGHVRLRRFLTVPVFSRDRIVAVVGAANKAQTYDETDILQLSLLMDAVWKEVERRDSAEKAEAREQALQRQGDGLLSLLIGGKLLAGERTVAARALTEAYARLSGIGRASLWRFNSDNSLIRCEDAFDSATDAHASEGELRSADFPAYSSALLRGELISASDVFADPRTRELPASYYAEHRIASLLDAPVWIGGEVGAILSLETV
ncbi:MAG: GAF domain-containing protein, partial [Spirochaetaceae bacterium]|nr:GAF domain-containing protein [Spirochaetaceae bacterium]